MIRKEYDIIILNLVLFTIFIFGFWQVIIDFISLWRYAMFKVFFLISFLSPIMAHTAPIPLSASPCTRHTYLPTSYFIRAVHTCKSIAPVHVDDLPRYARASHKHCRAMLDECRVRNTFTFILFTTNWFRSRPKKQSFVPRSFSNFHPYDPRFSSHWRPCHADDATPTRL